MALSSRMPELSALEVFLEVAKTASLGAAGRELGLTQQAVSARLTSIEAQTGVRLAVRTVRGTQLTPAGVVAAQWANRLLDVAQEVDAGLGSLRSESRSKLKVAASLTVAEQLMPLWLGSPQATAVRSGRKGSGGHTHHHQQRARDIGCARRRGRSRVHRKSRCAVGFAQPGRCVRRTHGD